MAWTRRAASDAGEAGDDPLDVAASPWSLCQSRRRRHFDFLGPTVRLERNCSEIRILCMATVGVRRGMCVGNPNTTATLRFDGAGMSGLALSQRTMFRTRADELWVELFR